MTIGLLPTRPQLSELYLIAATAVTALAYFSEVTFLQFGLDFFSFGQVSLVRSGA